MAATMDAINTHVSSPLSTTAPPSASSSTGPGHGSHGYPSPPVTAIDEPSASEDESGRGRSKFPLLPDPAAALDRHSDTAPLPVGMNASRTPSVVKSRRRQTSSSTNKTSDSVQRLTAAEVQELTSSPDSLPIAPAPERHSIDQEMAAKTAEQREILRQRFQSRSPDTRRLDKLQTNGAAAESYAGAGYAGLWHVREGAQRQCSPRTVSTPPTSRAQQYVLDTGSQPTSPRRYSYNPLPRPTPLNLNGEAANGSLNGHVLSPAIATSPAAINAQQASPAAPSQGYTGPSPPSPIPSMIPLPPMSLPTHLQLELAAQRPSPLYIHQSYLNGIPYESYAVKLERLKNVLLLPPYLERTLPSDVSDRDRSRSRNRVRELLNDDGGVSAPGLRDRSHLTKTDLHVDGNEGPKSPLPNKRHPVPQLGTFRHKRTKSIPSSLSAFHKADLLQGAVIICSSFALMTLDASRMYHFIRAQSAIKLYVIYNILEVGDRLLSALGQDILECLFSNETLSRNPSGRSKILLPLGMFILALVYNCLHSIALYYQVITLNVAVNSYSNALLTLLLSNQFVEIKSTVFKRFEKDNLFQLTCADIVERFHLWIMLLIIGMRNIVEVGAFSVPGAGFDSTHEDGSSAVPLHPPSILPHSFTVLPSWLRSGEALSPFLIVVGSEMLVDTIKHAYVTKFNNIKPNFYGRTLDILCKDYYTNAFVTPSLTRRLGLAVIPLSCLFIRASIQTYHMFLATHVPMPIPPSTQTSLTEESAVPSSPAMIAALSRFDALIRDSLGRATYGYPYGSPLNSRPWYSWTSDDLIAALTMVVVFFIVFLVLLILKLLLGMVLLQYSRNRYAKMKQKESLVALGKAERESYDATGRRVGGRGDVEVTDDKARWIHADKSEGLKGGKGPGGKKSDDKGGKKPDGDYMGVARYEMVAKRIW
ncbi:Endoplasmic reticulum membrane protein 65 [Metarhizium anisopliae]